MPSFLKRRSTLDLLTSELRAGRIERDNGPRSDTPTEHRNPSLNLPRARSAHDLQPSPTAFGDDAASLHSATPGRHSSLRISRHFSDSQLSTRAKVQAALQDTPPVPALPFPTTSPPPLSTAPPVIMTTSPTVDLEPEPVKKKPRGIIFRRQNSALDSVKSQHSNHASPVKEESKAIFSWGRKSQDTRRTNGDRLSMASGEEAQHASSPQLMPPPILKGRKSSELKRKSMFGLPKREKKPLFPLPPKGEMTQPQYPDTAPATPRVSTSNMSQRSAHSQLQKNSPGKRAGNEGESSLHGSAGQGVLGRNNVSFAPPGYPLIRNDSNHSIPSAHSSPNVGAPRKLTFRDRASTHSTVGRPSEDFTPPTPPTLNGSTRNSTSTSGRASLGGFLTLNRFRGDAGSRHDSPGTNSKQNSMTISRDTVALPERVEGETPAKYLERLQGAASRNVIAAMLSKSTDTFSQNVLRSYTRRFAFFGEPIDMSLRKFLLEAELPKETQQVDRVMQAFADRYHECNPGIFFSPDEAYVIAFSLMMLHTDAFNKNNKYKMQKNDYIRNTRGQHVSEDVLACFYDNICYTPFIHFDEDDFDAGSDRLSTFKTKKAKLKGAMPDPGKKSNGPVDPYSLIIENKLDVLRPASRDAITLEDPYSYLGPSKHLDASRLQKKFHHGGVLQIISARSRPAAFESQASRDNPEESKPGVVDLQVTKVGILWRKSAKRKKTRSPWQEWGAILTGSQLYFFRNTSWVKSLMQQYNSHQKHMVPPSSVVFKPPLEEFKPDSLIKTDDAVALTDSTYNRHKNAFTLVRHGGEEEILLADNEGELNDWLALINYAAAFRSAGVRIRGLNPVNNIDGQPTPLKRSATGRMVRATEDGHYRVNSMNPNLERQIMAARRRQMIAKIAEAEINLTDTDKLLEEMLRDARHLLILAPIQPRTREVVIHSLARIDAQIKWTRRETWRTRCYKDILYIDALEDDDEIKDEASKLRPITIYPTPARPPEIEPPALLAGDGPSASPAPSVRDGVRTQAAPLGHNVLDDDIFRTPPESARAGETWSWRLPPIDLDSSLAPLQSLERPSSVSSAVPSTASVRRPSVTHISSASSIADASRLSSATPADRPTSQLKTTTSSNPITPASSHKREPLTSSITSTTVGSARRASDSAPSVSLVQSTPDTGGTGNGTRTRSHRKSLHRTLRDGFHEPGSVHRHRKGKESASTVKSEGACAESEDLPEGTPGLERGQGRFILHGKQASVITFGEGWQGGIRMPTIKKSDEIRPSVTTEFSPSDDGDGPRHVGRDDMTPVPEAETPRPETHKTDRRNEPPSPYVISPDESISADAQAAAAYAAGVQLTDDDDYDGVHKDNGAPDNDDARDKDALAPRRASTSSFTSGQTGSFFDARAEKDSTDEPTRTASVKDGRRSSAELVADQRRQEELRQDIENAKREGMAREGEELRAPFAPGGREEDEGLVNGSSVVEVSS